MHRYNFRETHLYLCPNCGHECTYKMPELMAQHAEEREVQNLKENAKSVIFLSLLVGSVKRWRFIIARPRP